MTEAKQDKLERKKKQDIELTQDQPVFSPATDIYEKDDAILVICDMPGVSDSDIDITLENDVLSIIGRQHVDVPDGFKAVHQGYQSGILRRAFTITTAIDQDKIDAKLNNGVLHVVLPKTAAATPKKIEVKTA